jgi:hypothetical protein
MEGRNMILIGKMKNKIRIPFTLSKKDSARNLFIYCIVDGKVKGVYRDTDSAVKNVLLPDTTSEAIPLETLKKSRNILLLPKSRYLVRVLEVPKVVQEETSTMLHLEVEAQVPEEYGKVEISYREIPSEREGYCRYEVYIARRDELMSMIDDLAKLGLQPEIILPTAIAWSVLPDLPDRADIYAISEDENRMEIISFCPDRTIALRTISLASGIERELSDFIRPFLGKTGPLAIGWIGANVPSHMANDQIHIKDLTYLIQPEYDESGKSSKFPLELFCSRILSTYRDDNVLHMGNLLPQQMVVQKVHRTIYRQFLAAASMFLVSLMLIYVALKIEVYRYQQFQSNLTHKIALIKTEGEEVGRRIDQLKAIQTARITRQDFSDILDGLYTATPQNSITYNQVELTDTGIIHLRGQAESLSLPFVLPEKLEKEHAFEEVLLKDAGQTKRGNGSVTEFRIDCKLKRAETR